MEDFRFWYDAKVINVYDADTMKIEIDMGLDIKRTEDVRLYGINAPELRGAEKAAGIKARDAMCLMLSGLPVDQLEKDGRRFVVNAPCRVNTIKDKGGKYGRLLVRVFIEIVDGSWIEANSELVAQGLAEYKDY
jgi:micrococcal nuclease